MTATDREMITDEDGQKYIANLFVFCVSNCFVLISKSFGHIWHYSEDAASIFAFPMDE